MGQNNKPITKGFRYFFGLHVGLCKALDEMCAIKVGGRIAWKGSATGQARFQIDSANLFGGDDGEGGIYGAFDLMQGWAGQPVNTRLARMLGKLSSVPVPAFRGVATGFFDGLVTSMSQYPKPWEFRLRRSAAGWDGAVWYPEKVKISLAGDYIHAMNPAHMLFEAITNREWGRGKDRAIIDEAQWRQSADALYAEGFGLIAAWKRSDRVSTFISSVLDHVGGSLVTDRRTGLLQLTLIRADYDADALPLFDEDSGLLAIEEDDNAASASSANEITVTYTNMLDEGKPGQVRVKNVASIQSIGGVLSTAMEYKHLPTAELALRVAQRDLRTKLGLKRFKVSLDRRAYLLKPGDVFRIRSVARGIGNIVLRAGRVDDGRLSSGAITVTAVQDQFGLPATSFVEVNPPMSSPSIEPLTATVRRAFEIPYRDLAANLTSTDLARATATSGALGVVARRPSYAALDFALITRVGSADYVAASTGDWCPTAQLIEAIDSSPERATIKLTHITDIAEGLVGQPALIGDEIVKVISIDWATGTAMIGRGCVDTVPTAHAAGSRIWFYSLDTAVDPVDYTAGVTVEAKVLTHTPTGWLNPDLAAVDSLTFAQRQARPYPPGNVLINGEYAPLTLEGALTVGWAHRDRVLLADQVIEWNTGSVGPEPGTVYIVRAYGLGDLLVHESPPVDGDLYVTEFAHDGPLRVTVSSVREGLECWQTAAVSFAYTGTEQPELPEEPFLVTEGMRAMTTEAGRLFALESLSEDETGPIKISELPAPASELDGSEVLALVQSGVTVQITAEALRDFMAAGIPAGRSAYQEAVVAGFEGDVAEWLESLRGPAGGPTHVRFVAGASYTLAAATDAGAWLECSAGEIRLPETTAAGFQSGMFVEVRQQGLGTIHFVGDTAEVVLDFDVGLFAAETRYQGGIVALKVIGTNTYALVGALADA